MKIWLSDKFQPFKQGEKAAEKCRKVRNVIERKVISKHWKNNVKKATKESNSKLSAFRKQSTAFNQQAETRTSQQKKNDLSELYKCKNTRVIAVLCAAPARLLLSSTPFIVAAFTSRWQVSRFAAPLVLLLCQVAHSSARLILLTVARSDDWSSIRRACNNGWRSASWFLSADAGQLTQRRFIFFVSEKCARETNTPSSESIWNEMNAPTTNRECYLRLFTVSIPFYVLRCRRKQLNAYGK